MANTFTGIKLQGLMGHFGKTAVTDIDGYVELPDGKVSMYKTYEMRCVSSYSLPQCCLN